MQTISVKQRNYTGQISEKTLKRSGLGTYKYSDLFSYTGAWEENLKHGQGVFTVQGHSVYSGSFLSGEISGPGEMRWADGRIFVGEFLRGEMNGKGTLVFRDEKYSGGFLKNKKSGFGIFMGPECSYSGTWKFNLFDGAGELRESGTIFRGNFSAGKKHGPGTLTFQNSIFTKIDSWLENIPQSNPSHFSLDFSLAQNPILAGSALPRIRLAARTAAGEIVRGESGRVVEIRLSGKLKIGAATKLTGGVIFSDFRRYVLLEGCVEIEGLLLPPKMARGAYSLECTDVTDLPGPFLLPPASLALLIN